MYFHFVFIGKVLRPAILIQVFFGFLLEVNAEMGLEGRSYYWQGKKNLGNVRTEDLLGRDSNASLPELEAAIR